MKVVCIIGSARSQGNTSFVVDKIIEGMKMSGTKEIKRYALSDMRINYCKGCNICEDTRECVQNDDMKKIISDILEANVVLIAAPSYWGDVPGQLKVFIDRCLPLCDTGKGGTIVPEGKYGVSVAIRAGQRKEENIHIIDTIEHYYGHLHIKPLTYLTMEKIHNNVDFSNKEEELNQAYELGLNLRNMIKDIESV